MKNERRRLGRCLGFRARRGHKKELFKTKGVLGFKAR
jgi:hypothetical protein